MEETFTMEEQKAMASLLIALAAADYRNRAVERDCIAECMKEMGLEPEGFVPIPKNALPQKAYETIKRMSKGKKQAFSLMMTRLSRSDTHFGPRERRFVKEILDMCDVPFVHK